MYATPNYDSWLYDGPGGPHDDTPDMIEPEDEQEFDENEQEYDDEYDPEPQESEEA